MAGPVRLRADRRRRVREHRPGPLRPARRPPVAGDAPGRGAAVGLQRGHARRRPVRRRPRPGRRPPRALRRGVRAAGCRRGCAATRWSASCPAPPSLDRCTLTDRHLVVRGDLRTYKIHLGGAGVLMEPGDVPLSIAGARKPGGRIFLPFEEDGTLALILAKAFLLAADTGITDESARSLGSAPNQG
ncbi:hypothetical protein ACFSTC_18945 [Nonomuraea ferruginea]